MDDLGAWGSSVLRPYLSGRLSYLRPCCAHVVIQCCSVIVGSHGNGSATPVESAELMVFGDWTAPRLKRHAWWLKRGRPLVGQIEW